MAEEITPRSYFGSKESMRFRMSQWDFPSDTDHMIMMTSFITISLRMLKNSIMSLAFSPIFPMQMPNAIKNPIRPVAENQKRIILWIALQPSEIATSRWEPLHLQSNTSGPATCWESCKCNTVSKYPVWSHASLGQQMKMPVHSH